MNKLLKKQIKIAYVIDEMNIGGTEKQLLKQIELLDKIGYRQYLICLRQSQFLDTLDLPCSTYVLNLSSLISSKGIRTLIRLASFFNREKIDIVQTYFIDANILGVLSAKIGSVSVIISCRRDMGFWYTKKILFVFKLINLFLNRILVNAEAIKDNVNQFENIALEKIDVLYNGIDLSPFAKKTNNEALKKQMGIPTQDIVVGIVANLNRRVKRVDLFIKTAYLVLKKRRNVSFVIVGGGHLEDELRNLSEALKIQDKIIFSGLQADIIPFLNLFDIGVLTSESEGFANSIIEYMAIGLPVVCYDSGGNRELIENGKNGFLVQVADQNEMAESILKIFDDADLCKCMRQANLEKVKQFSWDNVCLNLDGYYRSLVLR